MTNAISINVLISFDLQYLLHLPKRMGKIGMFALDQYFNFFHVRSSEEREKNRPTMGSSDTVILLLKVSAPITCMEVVKKVGKNDNAFLLPSV